MALVKPIVFQVVGYQNSGKTTYTLKLIESLKAEGIVAATIKHHGHGGKPDATDGKDSTKHLEAGAIASVVEGEGRLILQADDLSTSLEAQVNLLHFFQPDIILVEGYKYNNYPKVLLLRGVKDLPLLTEVTNVKVVVYWKEDMKEAIEAQLNAPCFHIHDDSALSWTVQLLKKCVKKEG